ncbi:MAG: alanine--tRNA ligase, partial [Cyanobacteria bacterium HKST-UBA06]|nr:alanine--tRNA ligase [Cyanobacteria bacterium HKST-UBA06]
TLRHHTFFFFFFNLSFGDYFKPEASRWAWQYFTEVLEIPADKLWVTIYKDDQASRAIWVDHVGVPDARILDMGAEDNFWGPPGATGPCGPCTELHFDRGTEFGGDQHSTPATLEGERFIELWNLVFMERFKDDKGRFSELEYKNIDTGMGLERLAMILQRVNNTFETDLLFPLVEKVGALTKRTYKQDAEVDVALKIVADHMRCVSFALADGVVPSNEGRGYIIRMVLRRAVRFARQLGLEKAALYQLVSTVRDLYGTQYPELKSQYDVVVETIASEEAKFLETLDRGSKLFEEALAEHQQAKKQVFAGQTAFKLYDTYGFPIELTQELVEEQGMRVDMAAFELAMNEQRELARSAQGKKSVVSNQVYADILKQHGPTVFTGYESLEGDATIVALIEDGQRVESVGGTNAPFELVLDTTPFYGESGGQVGDRGILYVPGGPHGQTVVVCDTKKIGDLFVHHCLFDQGGSVKLGQQVRAEVSADARSRTAHHHSATHLLHAALKEILGDRVGQAGSYVGPDGARFDFTFHRAVKAEELQQVELLINQWVFENTERDTELMGLEDAKAAGAAAMFDEKYGDEVRVVTFGAFSKELCGGTHVDRLGDIGLVKILSEGSIASGVRRIEFVTGRPALLKLFDAQTTLQTLAESLKSPLNEVEEKTLKLVEEKKALEKELAALQSQAVLAKLGPMVQAYKDKACEAPWLVEQVAVPEGKLLKDMAEALAQQTHAKVVVLGADVAGKAQFVVLVSHEGMEAGLNAGQLVKLAAEHCQGGGGGKPNFAQAGGKDGQAVGRALELVQSAISQSLAAAKA